MQFKRADRVRDLIQKEISDILLREIKDTRIGFVTITRVEITDDLKEAIVYISVIGSDDKKKKTLEGLQSATGYIRGILGHRLDLRYVPKLLFKFDENIEYSIHIAKVIEDLKKPEEET